MQRSFIGIGIGFGAFWGLVVGVIIGLYVDPAFQLTFGVIAILSAGLGLIAGAVAGSMLQIVGVYRQSRAKRPADGLTADYQEPANEP